MNLELIAILRGVDPTQVIDVTEIIVEAGIQAVEVPMNSPEPLLSIDNLRSHFGDSLTLGAGTVTSIEQVQQVKAAGAQLVLAPNTDAQVITEVLNADMVCVPGVATATEAFSAIRSGAQLLKLFPAAQLGVAYMQAIKAVLPSHIGMVPVGGIDAGCIAKWWQAGVTGLGLGSSLFHPRISLRDLADNASQLVRALKEARHG